MRQIAGEQDLEDADGQKVWIYSDCPEADRTTRETELATDVENENGNQVSDQASDEADQTGDQVDDEAGDKTTVDVGDNENDDLVNVCFEVTRTDAKDSYTTHPEKLLLFKGLADTGQQMFENDNSKTTCVDVRPHVMPRITFSSADGVSFQRMQ